MKKTCTKCKLVLSQNDFSKDRQKKDGLSSSCKQCHKLYRNNPSRKQYIEEYNKNYSSKNKIQILLQRALYRLQNKDLIKKRNAEYRLKNKDILSKNRNKYRKENIEKERQYHREYNKRKRSENINYRILCNLRSRVYDALKGQNKSKSVIDLMGCPVEFLKSHLESQFKEGMNWDNYGKWHIDHIRPCASFDLTDIEQQKQCFHYTNLQPLWAIDNIKKSNK